MVTSCFKYNEHGSLMKQDHGSRCLLCLLTWKSLNGLCITGSTVLKLCQHCSFCITKALYTGQLLQFMILFFFQFSCTHTWMLLGDFLTSVY